MLRPPLVSPPVQGYDPKGPDLGPPGSPVSPVSPGPIPGNSNVNEKPLAVEDCLTKMIDFVETHKLQPIIGNGLSNNELKRHLRPQAEIAAKLPQKLGYISPELVMPLAIMGLYDLAVLIGR